MVKISLHQSDPTNGKLLLQPRAIKSTDSLKMEFDSDGRLLVDNLV